MSARLIRPASVLLRKMARKIVSSSPRIFWRPFGGPSGLAPPHWGGWLKTSRSNGYAPHAGTRPPARFARRRL